MNYPRIYSLSTVGILKHYIHDYLFHEIRTDFIGPNGVGKSIIADLLQILFIYEKESIQFGTDGVKTRDLASLPYNTNIAYCFINVEVEEGRFLLLGTALSAQRGVRLTPFVITASSNLNGKLEELTIGRENIPIARSFLKDDQIPGLDILAREFLEQRNLYLTFFRNREQIKQYYQFLYDKQILSINLSVETNFEAFSKVIQSFSKAKALNLTPASASKSLKDFLFEDSEQEILDDYQEQQYALAKILREYERLEKEIRSLTAKRQQLLEIKDLDQKRATTLRKFKEGELSNAYYELQAAAAKESKIKEQLTDVKTKEGMIAEKMQKLPRIKALVEGAYQAALALYDLYPQYKLLTEKIETIEKQIIDLRVLSRPAIPPAWAADISKVDMSARTPEFIKSLIHIPKSYLSRYRSLSHLEAVRKQENDERIRLSSILKAEEQKLTRLFEMLETNARSGLFGWMVDRSGPLTSEQRNAVLQLSDIPIAKPQKASSGDRYLDPDIFLDQWNIEPDPANNGFWLCLGASRELIVYNPDSPLLDRIDGTTGSIEAFLAKKRAESDLIRKKFSELDKLSEGDPYDAQILDRQFDPSIVLRQSIDKLKEAIACILHLDEKIGQLQSDKKRFTGEIQLIKDKVPVNYREEEPEALKKNLSGLLKGNKDRHTRIAGHEQRLSGEYKQTKERMQTLTQDVIEVTRLLLSKQNAFNSCNQQFFVAFGDNLMEYPDASEIDLVMLEESSQKAYHDYVKKYHLIVEQFEETAGKKNISVNIQIENETYAFRALEEGLLGSRIKTTDDIADALSAANQGRLSVADEMKVSIIRVFETTLHHYRKFKDTVQNMNKFFIGKKISNQFFFKIEFSENRIFKINFVEEIGEKIRYSARKGELAFDKPVDEFIQDFFKQAAKLSEQVKIDKLLSPNTYFDLSISLTDEHDNEISGSSGETYSAIALLGIARLSIAQAEKRKGLRFIILEELGTLDNTNFSTFPAIAREFHYQIVTMAPRAYMSGLSEEWYAHHLIKGKVDEKINFYPSASYFLTTRTSTDLETYLKRLNDELARNKSSK